MYTPVWRLKGLTGSEAGHLELRDGRLLYTPIEPEKPGFDVPLADVKDVHFPWHYFGGGFKVRIGGEEIRFSFIEPHNDQAEVRSGRASGKEWRKLLIA